MSARQRLKNFLKSDRGNVLAMGAAALPMLLASAGFAVDTIQVAVMKRQLQRAADSGAIAGAYALTQAPAGVDSAATALNEKTYAETAAKRDVAKNKTPTLGGLPTVVTGPIPNFERAVRVDLVARPRLPFMAIFTKSNTTIAATATAALVENGRFCMLSLYDRADVPGITITGNAELDLGCGMATNARGATAISAGGSSEVRASPIMAPGGLPASSTYATGTELLPYSAEQKDPFAHLNVPSYDSTNCPALSVDKQNSPVTITAQAGTARCYSSIDVKGGTLNVSGEIVVKGNISFDSKAVVQGTNVTFFMTNPGGSYDSDANASLKLKSPTSGTYKDVLFYRDRNAPYAEFHFNGNVDSTFSGAIYFPTADIVINGNAGFNATCFQLVARRLTFSGSMSLKNTCTNPGDGSTFALQFVRLVR
jgi:Flp pilus assembly protein TadG